jgi:uncharacterized membrane protein
MTETPHFPMAPVAFPGHSREVDPGACFEWLRQGWAMFISNPGVWIGSTILLLVIILAISIVPLFGQIAANLLLPVFAGGLLQLCRRQADAEQPEISDLFAGFKHNAGSLVMVGVFYTAGIFGIALLAFLLISGGILGGVVTGQVGGFGVAVGGMLLAGLLVVTLSIPVIMATWFAPALVFFHNMAPIEAMKASFAAGLKNWLPMAIFAIILVVCVFFAMLPLALGMILLVPIFCGAAYASYRDIFVGA